MTRSSTDSKLQEQKISDLETKVASLEARLMSREQQTGDMSAAQDAWATSHEDMEAAVQEIQKTLQQLKQSSDVDADKLEEEVE